MFDPMPLLFLSFAFLVKAITRTENISPDRADPRGQIICDFGGGNIRDQRAHDDLRFCAKPQYGGSFTNIGGYCGYTLRPRQLAFDNSPISWTVAELSSAYWQNYCQIRCRCKYSIRRHKAWPELSPRYETDIITLDYTVLSGSFILSDDRRRFVHTLTGTNNRYADSARSEEVSGSYIEGTDGSDMDAGLRDHADSDDEYSPVYDSAEEYDMAEGLGDYSFSVLTIKIPIANQTGVDPVRSRPVERWISLSKSNQITCSGDLPVWLPRCVDPSLNLDGAPSDTTDTEILQRLCATALSGGNPDMNAGGVCFSPVIGRPYVRFLDNWAGTKMLTTEYQSLSVAVRTFCFTHCRCLHETEPISHNVPSIAIPLAPWHGTARILDGGRGMTAQFQDGGDTLKTIQLVPYYNTPGRTRHRPLSCPTDRDRMHVNDPPISAALEQQQSTMSKCGGHCRSSAECSESSENPCKCAVDVSKVMTTGLDRVFGVAFCLAQMAVQVNPNPKLGGRDGLPAEACVCNSTYVSFKCCASQTGIIWEPKENRLGRL